MSYVNGDFEGCTFEEASFEKCRLVQCTLVKCNVWHSELKHCNTRGCDLKHSKMDSCDVRDGDFQLASGTNSRISTSKLSKANFTNCELYDTNFFLCSFQSCTFRNCFAGPKRVSFRPTSSNVADDIGMRNATGSGPTNFVPTAPKALNDNTVPSTLAKASSVTAAIRIPLKGANCVPLGVKRTISCSHNMTPEPQTQLQKYTRTDCLSIDLDAVSNTPGSENLIDLDFDLDSIASPICYSPTMTNKRLKLSGPLASEDCRFL